MRIDKGLRQLTTVKVAMSQEDALHSKDDWSYRRRVKLQEEEQLCKGTGVSVV